MGPQEHRARQEQTARQELQELQALQGRVASMEAEARRVYEELQDRRARLANREREALRELEDRGDDRGNRGQQARSARPGLPSKPGTSTNVPPTPTSQSPSRSVSKMGDWENGGDDDAWVVAAYVFIVLGLVVLIGIGLLWAWLHS